MFTCCKPPICPVKIHSFDTGAISFENLQSAANVKNLFKHSIKNSQLSPFFLKRFLQWAHVLENSTPKSEHFIEIYKVWVVESSS